MADYILISSHCSESNHLYPQIHLNIGSKEEQYITLKLTGFIVSKRNQARLIFSGSHFEKQ